MCSLMECEKFLSVSRSGDWEADRSMRKYMSRGEFLAGFTDRVNVLGSPE